VLMNFIEKFESKTPLRTTRAEVELKQGAKVDVTVEADEKDTTFKNPGKRPPG
jgi:hypothetical protein